MFFVTKYMYDARRRDFAYFDDSEVSGTGNDSIVQKQYCVVEEITEVELRSCRGKFIYNRTYNSVG